MRSVQITDPDTGEERLYIETPEGWIDEDGNDVGVSIEELEWPDQDKAA